MKGQLFQPNELYFSLSEKASAGCVSDMQYKNENKALLNPEFLIFGLISEFAWNKKKIERTEYNRKIFRSKMVLGVYTYVVELHNKFGK